MSDLTQLLDRLVNDTDLRRILYEADRDTFHTLVNAAVNQLVNRKARQ